MRVPLADTRANDLAYFQTSVFQTSGSTHDPWVGLRAVFGTFGFSPGTNRGVVPCPGH